MEKPTMKAWNVSPEQIENAAASVGVRLVGLRPNGVKKFSHSFTLKTSGPTSNGSPVKFGRRSQRSTNKDGTKRRIPGSVCWHGHRDFMLALYRVAPTMRLKTALADYRNAEHFERTYRNTYESGSGGGCDC
jgi:hypothetical protein